MDPPGPLGRTRFGAMDAAWRASVAALPASERARLAEEADGLVRSCAWFGRVRDAAGIWIPVGHLLLPTRPDSVTHGICPPCREVLLARG